jgi:DNA-binding NarL/FixJ family response regulator
VARRRRTRLDESGCQVVGTAGDRAAAVRVANATRPDVVVMDLQLPQLSGVEATRSIVAAHPQTRVLVLSASGEPPGLTYKQIAERLFLSHRSVQNHVQNTLNKLQMHTRYELVRYAVQKGLDADD